MIKNKILIVDDDELCLDILTEYLHIEGYTVATANNGIDALNIIENKPAEFDLVVIDRMMPKLNGIELTQKIRENKKISHLPIIMQTGMATKENEFESLNAGVNICLSKPFTRQAFIYALKQLLKVD